MLRDPSVTAASAIVSAPASSPVAGCSKRSCRIFRSFGLSRRVEPPIACVFGRREPPRQPELGDCRLLLSLIRCSRWERHCCKCRIYPVPRRSCRYGPIGYLPKWPRMNIITAVPPTIEKLISECLPTRPIIRRHIHSHKDMHQTTFMSCRASPSAGQLRSWAIAV